MLGNQGPGISVGLLARRVPVALVEAPLAITVAAGDIMAVPVRIAPGGRLAVTEVGLGDVGFSQSGSPEQTIVTIPASGHARTVVLAWRRDPAVLPAIPAPPPPDQVQSIRAGTPVFFDLARGEERGFALTVPQGGLYRIETLGRLHTSARLATPFIPRLGDADANGAGQNMLLQSVLRAGRYRVDVQANASTGHLGLAASLAPLRQGATLLPGGSVRATLPAGTGVGFPIEVGSQAENYRLNVYSPGAAWTGRLEDADGWPLTTPGPLDGIEQALPPGHYRLVVTPDVVDRKVVAELTPLPRPVDITGHGPHALPFGTRQTATWREPDGRDQKREPDAWRFGLSGSAQVTLTLGDGMIGELRRAGSDGAAIRIVGTYQGRLEAGSYMLEATSLGRNDRLGYSVALDSKELQPGVPRDVTLPASLTLDIARPGVVSLTSFGNVPVRAELRHEDGTIVGRYGARQDDWNIAASRLLPAGRYRLQLRDAAAPEGNPVNAPNPPTYARLPPNDTSADTDDSDDAPRAEEQQAQTPATRGMAGPSQYASLDSDTGTDDGNKPAISLRLALPEQLAEQPAPATATQLPGQGVHVLTVNQPAAGTLLVAQAASPAALVLALERQAASGWQTVAIGAPRSWPARPIPTRFPGASRSGQSMAGRSRYASRCVRSRSMTRRPAQ